MIIGTIIIFSYKNYSINLQKNKEKEIINTQLLKEKEILEIEIKNKEQEKIENEIVLNNCLEKVRQEAIALNKSLGCSGPEGISENIQNIINYHMKNGLCKNLIKEDNCVILITQCNNLVIDSANKGKNDCYNRYPQD